MTARTRILAWIMLIVTLAVLVMVMVTGRSMIIRVRSVANDEVAHEAQKFREFAARPDPETGEPFTSVEALLTSYLVHNLAEPDEMFFTIVNGVADRRSAGEPPVRLDLDGRFVDMVVAASGPSTGTFASSAGPVLYAAIPVEPSQGSDNGVLVIAEFLEPGIQAAWSAIWTMSAVAAVTLSVAGLSGWFVAGRVLAPIRDLRTTAAGITGTELGRRIEVDGTDDVAQLASTFNSMLDRLESTFDGQRRFLDDAGHELRTPITIVRGHLELMGQDPDERAQTLALVDDELARMARLVDDLILLARSERPDFIVAKRCDLADLVVETFTKATALAERHWTIDTTPEVHAVIDQQRVTQALLQLVANAVAHTVPGDTIAVGGRIGRGNRVLLWVRDTGAGIDPSLLERIFDRFTRGDSARRSGSGSGLGLAIVQRIAIAHGGTVTVESAPGRGSTFTMDLPWLHTSGQSGPSHDSPGGPSDLNPSIPTPRHDPEPQQLDSGRNRNRTSSNDGGAT